MTDRFGDFLQALQPWGLYLDDLTVHLKYVDAEHYSLSVGRIRTLLSRHFEYLYLPFI